MQLKQHLQCIISYRKFCINPSLMKCITKCILYKATCQMLYLQYDKENQIVINAEFASHLAHIIDAKIKKYILCSLSQILKEIAAALLEKSAGKKQENAWYQRGHELLNHSGFTITGRIIGTIMDPTVPPRTRAENLREMTAANINNKTATYSCATVCEVLTYPVVEALTIFCILSLRNYMHYPDESATCSRNKIKTEYGIWCSLICKF